MSGDNEDKFGVGLFQGLVWPFLCTPLLALSVWSDGFVLAKLWLWYAVPLGARPVAWQPFAALMLAWAIVRFKTKGQRDNRSAREKAMWFVASFVWPWAALVVGWWFL